MNIAATYENGQITENFDQTEQFKLYTIDGNRISTMEVVSADGVVGCDALAAFLKVHDVGILVCGKLSPQAQMAVMQHGIAPFPGAYGDADLQVGALAAGLFAPVEPEPSCDSTTCDGNCAACRSKQQGV